MILKFIVCILGMGILVLCLWDSIIYESDKPMEEMEGMEEPERKLICLPQENLCDLDLSSIRVLIRDNDFKQLTHKNVALYAKSGLRILCLDQNKEPLKSIETREEITFEKDSFSDKIKEIWIEPADDSDVVILKNLSRAQGQPAYRGKIELINNESGIVIINELSLEEYLYCVVPSEMPSDYPKEALKTQAICARTYAAKNIIIPGYPEYGAHVDDSTAYQVYNNIEENKKTTSAVEETKGKLLAVNGTLADTYYYSTSCGMGSNSSIWKTENAYVPHYLRSKSISRDANGEEPEQYFDNHSFYAFITHKNENDYEAEECWYRWEFHAEKTDESEMLGKLIERYEVNQNLILTEEDGEFVSKPIDKLGRIINITVGKRGAGGIVDELVLEGTEGTYKIISEYNIRYILNGKNSYVIRQDGIVINNMKLLPSAFFILETGKENQFVVEYNLIGGGFGHGVGMSQNAAKEMAKAGMNAEDILAFFYPGCEIYN